MATFRIGVMVRVVRVLRPERNSRWIGSEGVIVGDNGVDWELEIAGFPTACLKSAAPDFLEPIQPSGHQPCETEFKESLDRLLEREVVL